MQEFILFEPSLILSKDVRSPKPYADLALATRALIAALAIEISVFGLLVWLISIMVRTPNRWLRIRNRDDRCMSR
jgi:hypothetical protein